MLVTKYVACMYTCQHGRQKILRESPWIPEISLKLDTQHILQLCSSVLTTALSKDYCTRKGCKCNSPHAKTLPSSFSCPQRPAVEIILCQILNRTCESTQHSVEPALASELMRSQWNHSPRLFNTMFSSHLLVQRPFPVYYLWTH